MNLCGLINNEALRQRLAGLAAANGWSIWLADDAQSLLSTLAALSPHPDAIVTDDPELVLGCGPSSAAWIYLGNGLGNDAGPDSKAALVDPTAGDERLLQDIRTCVNAQRFRARFAALDRTEPITSLPRHEELCESLAPCKGKTMGLMIVHLDHADHLYGNLDPVSKTDLLSALGEHIQRSIPCEGRLGFFDAACFVIALPNIDEADLRPLGARILTLARKPIVYNGGETHVTVSIGHSFDANFSDTTRLWSSAWQAMDLIQRAGGDGIRAAQDPAVSERIPQALERDEFSLLLQGQWHLEQDRFSAVEALIRWQGMEVGELAPSHFIPIAEARGHMARIGDWVLEQACREASTWYQNLVDPLLLAVNVSPQQFHKNAILKQIRRFGAERWLNPAMLELELNQEGMLHLVDAYREQLYTLRDWGVRFALDNLGSGLIDARKLLRCPVDTLKIDRALTASFLDDPQAADLVAQICELGRRFDLRVVAVGVEAQAQLQELARLGCSSVQGYLLSPPVPLHEFHQILQQKPVASAKH